MKVLILYSEIAGYLMACVRRYVTLHGATAHVVRWPINPEAPFQFPDEPGITYHERSQLDDAALIRLAKDLKPDALYIAGWIDKGYLKVASHFRKLGKPVICAFDTQWRGDLRQRIATWVSPFAIRNRFSHAWVPGMFQYEYARRLGFPRERILTGMYSADTALFDAVFQEATAAKVEHYPHRLIYVGRYLALKGVLELYHGFKELSEEMQHDWELVLIGNGPLKEELSETHNIRFKDFLQPAELPRLALEAGAFILPSRSDAWAVVLHEFACAGLPLVSTDAAGGITAFVKEGYNGFIHRRRDKDSLKQALKRLIATSDDDLRRMGRRSQELSRVISPDTWAATLHHIVEGQD